MVIHCGSLITMGHGETAECGQLYYGEMYQCQTCKINALKQRAEAAEAERDRLRRVVEGE